MKEKKTTGKLIAALRQAKGLTQKELGDMLYVSNKTVSRWERDECSPDLYLIPAIAEIFGITSDELLRGEIKNQNAEKFSPASNARAEKRIDNYINKKYTLFRNLSFISFILALVALAVAVICVYAGTNYSNEEGYTDFVWLGFTLAALTSASGIICEICFALNGLIDRNDDFFGEFLPKIQSHNAGVLCLAAAAVFTDVAVLSYCLPLLFLSGEQIMFMFLYWVSPGAGLAAIFVVAAYAVYDKILRQKALRSGLISYSEVQQEKIKSKNKLLFVISLACGIIFIILLIAAILVRLSVIAFDFAGPITYIMMLADAITWAAAYFTASAIKQKKYSIR